MNEPVIQSKQSRRKFDTAFKHHAVELWLHSGKSATEVAAELGIHGQRLSAWRKRSAEQLEVKNTDLRRENDYLRDQRPDCKQVNIGLVVTPEGLPIAYEVFAGNTVDVTTVEDMVEVMEKKYGQAKRIWVLDRGMVSEENLDFLRERQARYIVGTPKSHLKGFEAQLLEDRDWSEVQAGVEVKLVAHPEGGQEQYLLCRSAARRQKEAAMIKRQRQRLRVQLDKTHIRLQRRPVKDAGKIERRIGRWLGRFPAAERLIEVGVECDGHGLVCGLKIVDKAERTVWAEHAHGAYLLRTNCLEKDPVQLWRWYMQLTQAEEAFRISKNDLSLRPVYHQKTERVEAHILVCFLSLAFVAHVGNVDAWQGPGHLRPAVDQGSGDGAKPGRSAARQRISEPDNPSASVTRRRASGPTCG
jgi:hypothetical protein